MPQERAEEDRLLAKGEDKALSGARAVTARRGRAGAALGNFDGAGRATKYNVEGRRVPPA